MVTKHALNYFYLRKKKKTPFTNLCIIHPSKKDQYKKDTNKNFK